MLRSPSPLRPPENVPFEFGDRREVAFGKHLALVADLVGKPDSEPFEYEIAVRPNHSRIVAALPVTERGEAVLIWQYRIPHRRYVLECPAGLVEPGETPEAAVVKEIREETGFRVSEVLSLGISTPTSSGATNEVVECFAAFGAVSCGGQDLESAEAVEVVRIPMETALETAFATASSGELVDAKVFALLAAIRHRFPDRFQKTGPIE